MVLKLRVHHRAIASLPAQDRLVKDGRQFQRLITGGRTSGRGGRRPSRHGLK